MKRGVKRPHNQKVVVLYVRWPQEATPYHQIRHSINWMDGWMDGSVGYGGPTPTLP